MLPGEVINIRFTPPRPYNAAGSPLWPPPPPAGPGRGLPPGRFPRSVPQAS